MARKVILDADRGIADTMAMCLAFGNPRLEVVAVTATGGSVMPDQASRNVQAIVERLDPDRWPRIGAADPDQPLRSDGRQLFGPDGLCGANLHVAELHHQLRPSKLWPMPYGVHLMVFDLSDKVFYSTNLDVFCLMLSITEDDQFDFSANLSTLHKID